MNERDWKKYWEDVWCTDITGMDIQTLDIKMEVGNLPKASFRICMNLLVEKQSDEDLEKLKRLVDEEIKYRKDIIPKEGFEVKK